MIIVESIKNYCTIQNLSDSPQSKNYQETSTELVAVVAVSEGYDESERHHYYHAVKDFELATEIAQTHAAHFDDDLTDEQAQNADRRVVEDVRNRGLLMKLERVEIDEQTGYDEQPVKDDEEDDDDLKLVWVEHAADTVAATHRIRFPVFAFGRHGTDRVVLLDHPFKVVGQVDLLETLHSHLEDTINKHDIDLIACRTVSAFKKHLDNYIFNQGLI